MADASTGVLMRTFYRMRAERPDLTKAQALQQAQLRLLRGDDPQQPCTTRRSPVQIGEDLTPHASLANDRACRWSHPYYWAPFVLMGSWL